MRKSKRAGPGEALRQMRLLAGLKQGDLAARLRVDQSQVSVMETGRRKVPLLALLSCAEACGFEMRLVGKAGAIAIDAPATYSPRGARKRGAHRA